MGQKGKEVNKRKEENYARQSEKKDRGITEENEEMWHDSNLLFREERIMRMSKCRQEAEAIESCLPGS